MAEQDNKSAEKLFGLVTNQTLATPGTATARKIELLNSEVKHGIMPSIERSRKKREIQSLKAKLPGTLEWEAEQAKKAQGETFDTLAEGVSKRSQERKQIEDAKRLLKESEPPKPEKYDIVPPRVQEPSNLKLNATRTPLTMVNDPANMADPFLAASKSITSTEIDIPTDWVAIVLSVKEEQIPDAAVQKQFTAEAVAPYTVRARRIQPAGEEMTGERNPLSIASNPDILLPNPCRISPSNEPKIRWIDINAHPLYSPASPSVPRPGVGDLVHVIIEPGKEVKRGVLLGLVPSGRRPLPETLEDFRTPQSTKATLAKNYPLTDDEETDSSGCATGNVSEDDIKKLKFITLKNPNTYATTLSKLGDNARRFIKAFDEELSRVGVKAIINSTIRTDSQQARIMYRNWLNHRPVNNTARIIPKSARDKYIRRLYGNWDNLDGLLESFAIISTEGGWNASSSKQKASADRIINANDPVHSSGNAIDVSFKGNTGRIWIAVKKAAKRTCSSVLIEKDHFHISAKPGMKFSWNKFTKKKFTWLDSPKGPPSKEKIT